MIAQIMDIATMEHASAAKDTLELIVQSHLAQIIVCLVENVLTTPVFAHLDGLTSIVLLNCAQMIVVEMDTAKMDHVFALLTLTELIVVSRLALEVATEMVFA
jgi:hypothetical protein